MTGLVIWSVEIDFLFQRWTLFIGNASQISLEMSDFTFISEDAEIMEVRFWLAYSSPTYRDDTRKKLILKRLPASDQGAARLVIVEEINLEVRV